jgi:hypothetical protein
LLRWWGHVRRKGVHADRPARDPAGKVKVDSAFQHLNMLQKHRQRQQGQFVPTESPGYDASVDYVAKLLKDKGFDIQTGAHLETSRAALASTTTAVVPRRCWRRRCTWARSLP